MALWAERVPGFEEHHSTRLREVLQYQKEVPAISYMSVLNSNVHFLLPLLSPGNTRYLDYSLVYLHVDASPFSLSLSISLYGVISVPIVCKVIPL